MEAADVFIEAFEEGTRQEKELLSDPKSMSPIKTATEAVNDIFSYFSQRQQVFEDQSDMVELWKQMVDLSRRVLRACTNTKGQILFLTDHERSQYQECVRVLPGRIQMLELEVAATGLNMGSTTMGSVE